MSDAVETVVAPVILAADGGAPSTIRSDRDPFESLDDLMALVEILCPQWPPRSYGGPWPRMLL